MCTHFVACLLFHYCNEMNCRKGQLSSNEVQLHVVLLAVAAMCAAHCSVLASWHRSRSLINSCCALLRLSFACWCLPVPQTTSWLQLMVSCLLMVTSGQGQQEGCFWCLIVPSFIVALGYLWSITDPPPFLPILMWFHWIKAPILDIFVWFCMSITVFGCYSFVWGVTYSNVVAHTGLDIL